MRIDILTLFPEMFDSPFGYSIISRAKKNGLIEVVLSNIRDYAKNSYKKVDDKPYGGGAGMVMMCQPVFDCIKDVRKKDSRDAKLLILSPQGKKFDQKMAAELSTEQRLMLLCGRYEGFDERIKTGTNAELVSIGDFVLSGGEPAAIVIVDAITRLLDGALGDDDSAKDDSFSNGLLEYPQYTRPEVFRDMKVPDVLLGGNHAEIEKWRSRQAIKKTKSSRPDLIN